MKLLYKFFAVAASMLALSSCVEEAIDPLNGSHGKPEVYDMTNLLSQEVIKGDKAKIFEEEVASEGITGNNGDYKGNGSVLYMKFIGDSYKLTSTTYSQATEEKAKSGNFLVGEGGSAYYKVENGTVTPIPIDKGSITVSEDETGFYLKGFLWLADGTVIEPNCKVKLTYEKVLTTLTKVLNAQSNVANGTNSVTLNLATEGITSEFDMTTYQTVYKGTGNMLAIDIYSEDGLVYPGTYKASAKGGEIKKGEFGIGWDPGDLWGIGMVFTNWGTCWWSITDGVSSAAHVAKGEIEVELSNDGIYTITIDNGSIYTIFNGAIPAVTPIPEGQYKMETAFAAINNQPYERNTVTVKMAEKGLTAKANKSGVYSFTGTGNYVSVELYSADGTLVPGTYTAAAKEAEGKFVTGSVKDNGNGLVMGSFFSTVTDGKEAGNVELINEGEVTVAENGGVYTITTVFNGKTCTYEGPVTVETPVIEVVPETPVAKTYTLNVSVEDVYDWSAGWPPALIEGIKTQKVTLTDGADIVASYELITAPESDIVGTYTCQAYPGTPGLMGNGYQSGADTYGGSYYVDNDGNVIVINPTETLTITKEGNVYTFAGSTGYTFTAKMPVVYTDFVKLLNYQVNTATGQPTDPITSVTISVATEGITTETITNAWGYPETKIKGNGQILSIDFYSADGTLNAGTYTACEEGGTVYEDEFGIGYDVEMWGQKMVWGTSVTPYTDDAAGEVAKVLDGTITVEVSGETYTIALESSTINAKYVGTLTL